LARGPWPALHFSRPGRQLLSGALAAAQSSRGPRPASRPAARARPLDGDRPVLRADRLGQNGPTARTPETLDHFAPVPFSVLRAWRLPACRGGRARRRPAGDGDAQHGGASPLSSIFSVRLARGGWALTAGGLPVTAPWRGAEPPFTLHVHLAERERSPTDSSATLKPASAFSDGGRRRTLCPRRDLPFGRGGGVLLHCPVLRPVLRLADTHWDQEERAWPKTAAHFSGEPEASTVSVLFFSLSLSLFF
jgi:hypothetical protein